MVRILDHYIARWLSPSSPRLPDDDQRPRRVPAAGSLYDFANTI